MSYRLSGSSPVRLAFTEGDARELRAFLAGERPLEVRLLARLLDALDAKIEEVESYQRRRRT